jgi:hypothetical protein
VRRADNLTIFICRFVLKFGILNILETSGPVQPYYGISLTFTLYILYPSLKGRHVTAVCKHVLMSNNLLQMYLHLVFQDVKNLSQVCIHLFPIPRHTPTARPFSGISYQVR